MRLPFGLLPSSLTPPPALHLVTKVSLLKTLILLSRTCSPSLSLSLRSQGQAKSGLMTTRYHPLMRSTFSSHQSARVSIFCRETTVPNYVTGWLHRRGHPYSHGGVNRCNSSSIEREPCLNNFLNQHRTLSCPLKSPTTSHGKLRRCNGFSVDFPQLTNLRGKHHTTQVASTQPDRPHMTRDESEGKREPRAALARAVRN